MSARLLLATLVTAVLTLMPAAGALAHVHGITPLNTLAEECGVTESSQTGANRSQSGLIEGLIPRDVGNAGLTGGDGGRNAPVGCTNG